MANFFATIGSRITLQWTDIVDIILVAFLVYKVIKFIRETRAEQLVKGLLFIVAATYISELCHLYALHYILKGVLTLGAVALLIVFQPELRRGLEYIGRGKLIGRHGSTDKSHIRGTVAEICRALQYFSDNRVGALLVFERETSLGDIIETGVVVDADITEELIGTVFYEGTPLHDGAAVIRGMRLYAAGCVLPLTQMKGLSKELGTRHRAALGMSENSDALVLVVSEETGILSMAQNGKLTRHLASRDVERLLLNFYLDEATEDEKPGFLGTLRMYNDRFLKLIRQNEENRPEKNEEEAEQEGSHEEKE